MARNKHRKVFRAIQLVVLKKTLCCSFFVCSNSHSDMNSLNENHVADHNLGFLSLFYYLVSLVLYLKMLRRVLIIFSFFMPVNSVQFRRTMELFNIQKFLTCNIFFIIFLITFRICSPLVLLRLLLFLRFISPAWKFKILKLAVAIRFSFIYIFYGSIHTWLYTLTIDLSGDIRNKSGPRLSSSQNFPICY